MFLHVVEALYCAFWLNLAIMILLLSFQFGNLEMSLQLAKYNVQMCNGNSKVPVLISHSLFPVYVKPVV